MKTYRSVFRAAILTSLIPTLLSAAFDQSGYPAGCSIYQVCEGGVCIRGNLPISSVTLIEDNGEYFMANSIEGVRYKLGYFSSLDEAQEFVSTAPERDFGAIIIPNNEVADAFGLNYHSVVTGHGTYLSENVTKLICSALRYTRDQ
ncbi:hypothetical protein [Yoonia sp. BS5-3]|uniref:Uncharacterized protein n=1 Tax=Yoonia phaeophyticola TaxID=3137369 RepID=A0ABZ2V1E3_9RHOB